MKSVFIVLGYGTPKADLEYEPLSSEDGTSLTVKPDDVLGFQVKVRQTFQVVPSSIGSGISTGRRQAACQHHGRGGGGDFLVLFSFLITLKPRVE